ncbi:hypothetical protein F511_35094 [Dorcoceras hygrometricum]|uniref:Triacylglycerol lipase n=1 Tax=Dorcoceras hygrometricum TaxID=472368 RepID=A0A2Z7ALM7_9LAMI|nr:hypothetical protein F511_35094 [Dorcoceras hygrometricum]
MGCTGQARTKPRRKIAVATLSETSPDGGRRHHIMCGTWPHARRDVRGMAAPCMAQPAHHCALHQRTVAGHLRNRLRWPTRDVARAAAPAAVRFKKIFFVLISKIETYAIQEIIVLKYPSPGSDTTIGDNGGSGYRFPGAPGSDQIHKETGTSNGLKNSTRTESPRRGERNKSDHEAAARGARRRSEVCGEERGGGQVEARIMVKRLATSPHDPLGITDSACKNQLVVVSVQYGPFNTYIPIRSTTIGKSRVARDPIAMHTSWRSNSEIASVTRVSMTFRVVRTNQYNQDLGLIHSTNGNHLESPNEGSLIDHQVTIHLHAQNITLFPTNETWYFTSQMLVSSSGGLILILTAQSTRNEFRMHSDY